MVALATLARDGLEAAGGALSPSATAVLLTLRHWQPLGVSELAGILAVRQPTMTSVVNGLVEEGLVERGAKQGRTAPLMLSAAGRVEADRLQDAQRHAVAVLLGPLDLAERAALVPLLRKVLYGAVTSRAQARTTCRFCDHGVCQGANCPTGTRATEIDGPMGGDQRGGPDSRSIRPPQRPRTPDLSP